jgi:hypothetical protein
MTRAPVLAGLLMITACGPNGATPLIVPTVTPAAGPPQNSPAPIAGTPIGPGDVVDGLIQQSDPVCFYNWDATGHCRQYFLQAPGDGTILATLRWPPPSRGMYDPEVFLVSANGLWEWAADKFPEKHVSVPAKEHESYRVVILAYGPEPQPFELSVQFQP